MKCIHCNTDSTYPERQAKGGKCKQCLHPFAFDPRANSRYQITDGLFQRAIKDVSGDGKLWYTASQLFYEVNRRLDRKLTVSPKVGGFFLAGITGIGGTIGAFASASILPFLFVSLPGVALGTYLALRKPKLSTRTVRLDLAGFDNAYIQHWEGVHGQLERLIRTPDAIRTEAAKIAPDVAAFSFDRAVVTETADVASMLVANNFHFENNCAILSLTGYPFGKRDTVMEMLRRNPQLKVYAAHDASLEGCGMAQSLRSANWFPDTSIRIIDLGLRPQHALRGGMFARKAFMNRSQKRATPAGLTAEEASWLAEGNAADLEQLRPARLMRSVYQGIARSNQAEDTGAAGDIGPGFIWIHDPVADVYAADSFG